MDPNAALEEMRRIATSILWDACPEEDDRRERDATRLAELVQGLDEWIKKGGFLPADWKR